jgi:hypothetical protein
MKVQLVKKLKKQALKIQHLVNPTDSQLQKKKLQAMIQIQWKH